MKQAEQVQKQAKKLRLRMSRWFTGLIKRGKKVWGKVAGQIEKRPMVNFFGALVMLFVVLTVVKVLGTPKPEEKVAEVEAKAVRTYQIGAVPTVTVQAKLEKAGVVTVVAQTPGVVSKIGAYEGDSVRSGQVLVSMGSTYTGANAASLSRQIAEKSYENTRDTFDTNMELIGKRRELAEKTDENSDELREISREALDRTRNQLDLSEEILTTVDDNLQALESASPASESAILSLKQLKLQYLSTVNGLKDAVANLEYSTDEDEVPARLSDLGREIAIKGLELEEKGLRLGLEVAELNLKLARVSEMMFYPQAPFAGTVERVFVKQGEYVNPGQPLVALAGTEQTMKAVALVSRDVAQKVSKYEASSLYLPNGVIEQVPQYVATEPTDGSLFAITWCQLDQFVEQLTDGEYISVDVPVGYPDSIGVMPFVPLDSVYQTQDEAYVFVMGESTQEERESDGITEERVSMVESRAVRLGQVYGGYVQVEEGIGAGDEVILDRTVVSGDRVARMN